jgi:hypothetical protein
MKAPSEPGVNLHITSVGPDAIGPGETFEVNENEAKQLEQRGLAARVGGAKAEPEPENKMAAEPENKTISAASLKPKKAK